MSGGECPDPLDHGTGDSVASDEVLSEAPRLVLSDSQHQTEHVLGYWIAVEHIRVAEPADSGVTTRYVNQVLDNARLLSGGNPRLFLNLLRGQVRWLRGLKPGEFGRESFAVGCAFAGCGFVGCLGDGA